MSSNKRKSEQRAAQSRAGEVVINRLLLMFMLSVVGIIVLLYMGRMSVAQTVWLYESRLPLILLIITGLLFAGAVFLFVKNRKRLGEERGKTINSLNLLCASAFVFLCSLYIKFPGSVSYNTIASRLLVVLVAVTVLYFVYYLYQREFFILSLITAAAGAGAYYSMNLYVRVALLAFAVLLVAACAVLYFKKGKIRLGKREVRIVSDGKYLPFFLQSVIVLAVSALQFALPGMSIYGLITVFAYYLIMGIYYTVRLM